MTDTKISGRSRGRPRAFDMEDALAKAQALFHEKGYDAVGIAALTEAMGISPPSFYAAFGSKAELFGRVLARYAGSALPLDDLLRPGRAVAEALGDLFVTAATLYSARPETAGCLVLESLRDGYAESARPYQAAARQRVLAFLMRERPDGADDIADYVDLILAGLSASARAGWDRERLIAAARTAARALP